MSEATKREQRGLAHALLRIAAREHKISEQSDRCQAIVKWAHNRRCKRRAVDGILCTQHARFGARVPASWEHWITKYGVICCEPHAPFRSVGGDA